MNELITIEIPTWIFLIWLVGIGIDIILTIWSIHLRRKWLKVYEKANQEIISEVQTDEKV